MPADLKVSRALNTQIKVTPEKPKGYRIQQATGSLTLLKRTTPVTDTGLDHDPAGKQVTLAQPLADSSRMNETQYGTIMFQGTGSQIKPRGAISALNIYL